MQTRIKFCGMTRNQDVQHAIDLGVDALGFVFAQQSLRNISVAQAIKIAKDIPPFVVKVGLFMNLEVSGIQAVLSKVQLNLLQFHGDEDEQFCRQFKLPYLKAVPMGNSGSVSDFCLKYSSAAAFVLDSHTIGQMGGSGETFKWSKIPKDLEKPIILAGGLTPDNVAEAVRVVRPYAVDVSSGIEASKGIKDLAKMQHFIQEVRRV